MLRRTVTNCSRLSESIELLDFDTVPETFYINFAFAHCPISLRSPFAHRAFTVFCSPLRSIRAHRALTVRSLCAQRSFSVRSPFTFNSSPLPFGIPKWKDHLRKHENKMSIYSLK